MPFHFPDGLFCFTNTYILEWWCATSFGVVCASSVEVQFSGGRCASRFARLHIYGYLFPQLVLRGPSCTCPRVCITAKESGVCSFLFFCIGGQTELWWNSFRVCVAVGNRSRHTACTPFPLVFIVGVLKLGVHIIGPELSIMGFVYCTSLLMFCTSISVVFGALFRALLNGATQVPDIIVYRLSVSGIGSARCSRYRTKL